MTRTAIKHFRGFRGSLPAPQHQQSAIDDFDPSSYFEGSSLLEPPATKEEKEGQPSNSMADHLLIRERQRLIALIARASDGASAAELRELTRLVKAALVQRATIDQTGRPRATVKSAAATATRRRPRDMKFGGDRERFSNGKLKLPPLPRGLRWPSKTYSEENRRHGTTIVQFLRDEWGALIANGFGELRWLRLADKSAAAAIDNFERIDKKTGVRRRLPEDVRFLRESEVIDRKLAGGLSAVMADPKLAAVLAYRVRHGIKVPGI